LWTENFVKLEVEVCLRGSSTVKNMSKNLINSGKSWQKYDNHGKNMVIWKQVFTRVLN
jgi:hypothetical protein